MPGAALPYHAVVGSGAFPGDAQPPGLDICWSGAYLNIGGRQSRSWTSCFENVLSGLVAKPFIEGDDAPKGPHDVIVRLGPMAQGPRPPDLIIMCKTVLDSHHLFLGVRGPEGGSPCLGGEGSSPRVLGLAKRFALVGEDFPTIGDLRGLQSVDGETSRRMAHDAYGYVLPDGSLCGIVPLMPDGLSHRPGFGRPLGMV
jgi:hypothetical protein